MLYRLKAIQKNAKPPVWRRVLVPSGITFAQLAVIMERMLDIPYTEHYEFEFYTAQTRLLEIPDGKTIPTTFSKSVFHAADTFINDWFDKESSVTFRSFEGAENSFQFRLEIEDALTGAQIDGKDGRIDVYFPVVEKTKTYENGPFQEELKVVNAELQKLFEVHEGKAEFLSFAEILKNVKHGRGITAAADPISRTERNEESGAALLRRLGTMMEDYHAAVTGRENRKITLEEILSSYSTEELQHYAEQYGYQLPLKKHSAMVRQLRGFLMDPECLKIRLLDFNEQELDLFEDLVQNGMRRLNTDEKKAIRGFLPRLYACVYGDENIQVPEEIRKTYKLLLIQGYREYHRRMQWMMTCMTVGHLLYVVTPLNVLYELYQKKAEQKTDEASFKEMVKEFLTAVPRWKMVDRQIVENVPEAEEMVRNAALMRKAPGFFIPDQQEMTALSNYGFFVGDPVYQELMSTLKRELHFDEDSACQFCYMIFSLFSTNQTPEIVMNLLDEVKERLTSHKQKKKFVQLLGKVGESTPRIDFGGFSPKQLKTMPIAAKPETSPAVRRVIYPNAPCPCGSGKKYKKCCGRKKLF